LTVTDIATCWTENRSVPEKTGKCIRAALDDIAAKMPFPILGVDSDNGSEFIDVHSLRWCQRHKAVNESVFARTLTEATGGDREIRAA
jgi:hypothetical protein